MEIAKPGIPGGPRVHSPTPQTDKFESLVSAKNRLRSLGIMRDDGTVDYSLVLEILSIVRSDEYLKNAVLRFVVQEFREDVRKMLGVSFAGIKLE
ncbi:MAG: hypothetical protein QXJ69_07805 [Desulfurococcaceae archaeon]